MQLDRRAVIAGMAATPLLVAAKQSDARQLHPAILASYPATANPDYASENVAALNGPLPDPKMRARMLAHMQTIPGFDRLETMPWYPGKKYPGVIAQAMAACAARLHN